MSAGQPGIRKEKTMIRHSILLSLMLVALANIATVALADKAMKVEEGLVLSVTAETLVMTDRDGKNERAQKVDQATAVTIDGKPAKLPELAKGDKVKVSIGQDGKVVSIMAMRSKRKPTSGRA
jgi:hypothetical protein